MRAVKADQRRLGRRRKRNDSRYEQRRGEKFYAFHIVEKTFGLLLAILDASLTPITAFD